MRFSLAHKLTTYLSVIAAYFALATSGELGAIELLLAFVGIVASWWWEPPRIRYERWSRSWTVLSILVFVSSVLLWLAGSDVLIVGTHFLLYLTVAKLFGRRLAKDYQQIYVLSFLMLVAGTVLNAGFSYGLFFLGYVVFATWALILFHLRREMEENFLLKHTGSSSQPVQVARILNSKRIVGPRFFVGTGIVSLLVFVGATIMFLAIPRIGIGLFFPKRRQGVNLTGFQDSVKLGGHGMIKDDPTVVMRVRVSEGLGGRDAPAMHWRGVAFDFYERGQWGRSERAPRAEVQHDYRAHHARVHMKYDRLYNLSNDELDARYEQGVRQDFYLEPMGVDVVFGASMPLAFEFDPDPDPRMRERPGLNDEMRHRHGAGIHYIVYSDPDRPPASVLREAPQWLPDISDIPIEKGDSVRTYEAYLQVPPEIPDRVRLRAEQITRNAPTWYDKAVAIEAYLRTEYEYTLEMVAPPAGQEPIDFFLFDRRKGHCEYFSSAMTIMLRTLGVPARNVNGFLGGAWNEYDGYVMVRGGDAHSWVEVYFPTVGWVTFDPTPPGDIDYLGRGGTGLLDKFQRFLDTLRLKWFQWVIEYDLQRQLSLFRSLRGTFSGKRFKAGFASAKKWIARNKGPTLAVLSLALAAIAIAQWLRRRRKLLEPLLAERPLTRSQSAIANVYLAVLARLKRRGFRRSDSSTAREHAAELASRGMPGAEHVRELAEIYYDAIYGQRAESELLSRARYLRDAVDEAWKSRKRAAQKQLKS